MKFILSNMSIAIPYFLWFSFAWNAFFQPLIFSLHVSLDLKLISCRHHMYGLVFVSIQLVCVFWFEHFICLCLSNYRFVCSNYCNFLNCLGFVFVGPFFFPSSFGSHLVTLILILFGYLFHCCVYIYYRLLVYGYYEFLIQQSVCKHACFHFLVF